MNINYLLAAADATNTQSLAFAIAGLAFVAIVISIAMFRYEVGGTMQIAGWLGTFMGLIAGAAITYFFNSKANESDVAAAKASSQAEIAKTTAELKTKAESQFNEAIGKYADALATMQKKYNDSLVANNTAYNDKLKALDERNKQVFAGANIPDSVKSEINGILPPKIELPPSPLGGDNSFFHSNLGLKW